jgi:multiple sugar transport system ATP-binding protein
MAKLELVNVCKIYDGDVKAVKDLNISCEDGEFLALLGPSGCGKSSTLRMIAGLETITSGELKIGGEVMNDMTSKERSIALAFESYALYPPMSVFENIAFPLRNTGVPRNEIKKRVEEVVKLVEIDEKLLDKKPQHLSGGQKQGVGLARALVRMPKVFLLDEPISHFDARHRGRLRVKVKRLQMSLGITMVYVTHDQLEAMAMADRIAIMNLGELQQLGTPEEIYNKPANTFVAGFIGDPPMNMFDAEVKVENNKLYLAGDGFLMPIDSPEIKEKVNDKLVDKAVTVGIRPDFVKVSKDIDEDHVSGEVKIKEYLGEDTSLTIKIGCETIRTTAANTKEFNEGDIAGISLNPDKVYFFNKETGMLID